MTDLWTAPRPWKGKTCHLNLRSGHKAYLCPADAEGIPLADLGLFYTVYDPNVESIGEGDGIGVHTDPRFGSHVERRLMGEGNMAGLEERRDHLPGRFVVCKAIGLAVHLGFSTIFLSGVQHMTPRAARNLDTMRRPLKGARVRLIECASNPEL